MSAGQGSPPEPPMLVITPTYNERDTIREVAKRVLDADLDADLLIVDDDSPDGTGDIADELSAQHERIHVLHRPRKDGLGPAYRAGFAWGLSRDYEIFVEMDADLSHDPAALPELVGATGRADLVIGSRYVPGGGTENWAWYRRALSKGGNVYVQVMTGLPVKDATSGFRAFRRDLLEELDIGTLRSDGYSFQLETVLRAWRDGFAIDEVPITFVERRHGASKISRAIVLEALWRVLRWGLQGPRRSNGRHPRSVLASIVSG